MVTVCVCMYFFCGVGSATDCSCIRARYFKRMSTHALVEAQFQFIFLLQCRWKVFLSLNFWSNIWSIFSLFIRFLTYGFPMWRKLFCWLSTVLDSVV